MSEHEADGFDNWRARGVAESIESLIQGGIDHPELRQVAFLCSDSGDSILRIYEYKTAFGMYQYAADGLFGPLIWWASPARIAFMNDGEQL